MIHINSLLIIIFIIVKFYPKTYISISIENFILIPIGKKIKPHENTAYYLYNIFNYNDILSYI